MKLPGFILALALPLLAAGAEADSTAGTRFFEEKVLPLLTERCLDCHSHQSGKMKGGLTLDSRAGWATGGDSGPAIVPGDLGKSLLIKAIRRTDPDLKMPPKTALSPGEVAILDEWVKRGAPDPRAAEAKAPPKIDTDWWSLRPLKKPALPGSSANPIDAFILAKLREQNLTPAPEADRRTLIRRLAFDLHGLPPSPEEVDNFTRDPDPQAYDKLVDRLLASPRYGERWARHWLDAIHFADTHGYEHDLMRTNAWRYRDYVIESFNRDTPWPRFIREQLAADVFHADQPRLTVALGFIAAGPWDHSTAGTAAKTFDYLDRDDMVTQTMSTFASVTVQCARCHDHKFDPISQEDYYALQAVFAGVGKGDVSYDDDAAVQRQRRRWRQIQVATEKADRAVLLAPENEALVARWEKERGAEAIWETVSPEVFLTAGNARLKRLEDGVLLAEGPRPETDTYTITSAPKLAGITAIRLEVLSDPALPMKGPGRQDNGNLHLSEFELRVFQPGTAQGEKVAIRRATADFNQDGWTISHALDGNEKTAWGIHPREGEPHQAVFELDKKHVLTNGARLTFLLKQLHGGGHLIGKFRLAVTGDDPARASVLPALAVEARKVTPAQRTPEQRLALAAHALRYVAEGELSRLPPPLKVFAGAADFVGLCDGGFYKPWAEPKIVNVLQRGDIAKPGTVAKPGALSAISGLPGRFALENPQSEAARRAALADWLADAKNPLTWRSVVNRVWHHHFGRGLSDSLNDFGRMGSLPTHPELLDWLACEFRDSGASLKALHRRMVTSEAYRRAARHDETAAARDPDNRFLWRHASRRMDAESYRDAVLSASGRLDLTAGGPGVQQFKLSKPIQITPTVDYAPFDWDSPGAGRRSIYRFVYRGLQDPFMDALDFPDLAQLSATRPFSASALQALSLLNNDFVLHFSRHFATRLEQMATVPEDRVRAAFRLAFQRESTPEECADFAGYAAKNGLPAMCRVLFNSNEFLFIN